METENNHETVWALVRRTREMLVPSYGNIGFQEKKSHKRFDQITELDLKVESFLKEGLAKTHPDIAFVGEETGGNRHAKQFWLVDPIDGTDHFIRGLPFCTTMLALIEEGQVICSAIYDFVNDILYTAVKGYGAQANGTPITVSNRPLGRSRMAWSMNLDNRKNLNRFLAVKRCCYLFHVGPTGYESAMIASGKIEGMIYMSPSYNDYDVAPGAFLIKEAGGMVANIGSKSYDYRNCNFIAANPRVFKELTEDPDAIFPIQPQSTRRA